MRRGEGWERSGDREWEGGEGVWSGGVEGEGIGKRRGCREWMSGGRGSRGGEQNGKMDAVGYDVLCCLLIE